MSGTTSTNDVPIQGSLRSYLTGLGLALGLTGAPFWIVMSGTVSGSAAVIAVTTCALLQLVVHLVFFLHLNTSSDQRWNLVAFIFTALIVCILVGGSLWIMYHLDRNMGHMT